MAGRRRETVKNFYASAALAIAALALSGSGPTMGQTTAGSLSVDEPGARFYQYAPAIVVEDGFENFFTCENVVSGVIRDNIVHRRYVPQQFVPGRFDVDGIFIEAHYVAGREVYADVALRPSTDPQRFDSFHVCDPEIVAGSFSYRGLSYHYALLYSANNKNSALGNQIGIAFANSLDGPWQRADKPLVAFDFSGADLNSWGVGQPAVVNTEQGHGFVLFYTQGGHGRTQTLMSRVHVNSIAATDPPFVVDAPVSVSVTGLFHADGQTQDYLSNAAFAYWPDANAFIIVRPQRPLPADQPNFLEAAQEIDMVDSADLLAGQGIWRSMMVIDPRLTWAARNHNAGIKKNVWGAIVQSGTLTAFITTSNACADLPPPCFPQQLWTYRVRRYDIPIAPAP